MIINSGSEPLISIIMNCYNGEKYLHDSLKSIINQTYENWELVFWDNLSKDFSKRILFKFSDKRIKYFKSKKFLNLYEARNAAIEKSTGDYIAFLDTDDLWTPDKLEKQVNFFKNNPESKIVYSNYFNLESCKDFKYKKYKKILPSGFVTQALLDDYKIGILTVLLEKNIFKTKKFNNEYNIVGDFDFFIKSSIEFKIDSIKEPLAYYRIHSSNFLYKNKKNYISELSNWISSNQKKLLELGFSLKKLKILLFKQKIKYMLNKYFRFNLR